MPRIVVPDNCKTAVSKPQHYDPVINPAYWELATHYNVAVIPARIREPQDKAPVEEGVRWLETWLLGWLRNQRFFSFSELNRAVRQRLSELVKRPFQKRSGTRLAVFNELDLPKLRPLVFSPFETADMKLRSVPDNYHVEYDGFYYSVPYTAYRQKVTIRATSTCIEIFDPNRIRIASHPRTYSDKRYITDPAHMPEYHRKYWDSKQFNGHRYRSWAEGIGENTLYVVDRMLTAQKIEEKTDLLILDDWGMAVLDPVSVRDLLEVVEDRFEYRSTIISAQLPVKEWHALFEDSTVADAVLDRLVHNAYRFKLQCPSKRRQDDLPHDENDASAIATTD